MTETRTHADDHQHPQGYNPSSEDHHISHSAALIAEVIDPATAHHIVVEEEKWINSEEEVISSAGALSSEPSSEKVGYTADSNENNDEELQRTQSKASLAIMMANFPDGGRRSWLALFGATLIAFSTFGIFLRLLKLIIQG